MEQSGFIVGIDMGTSKIVGLLARKNEQGVVTVLASETISTDSCVRHGVVYNIDEAAGKVKRLINLLENKTGKKIARAYFSVAGKSLESLEHTETLPLPSDTDITVGMVDKLESKAKTYQPDNFLTNYGVVAPQYFLDGVQVEDPAGRQASLLEAKFRIIVGRPNIKNNIRAVADKAGVEVAGFIVGAITTSALALTNDDKAQGCVLLDLGAGTTNVSVYKDGLLKFFKVIPFGGRTVTKDIRAIGFIEAAAEDYKIRYGRVGKDRNKNAAEDRADSGIDVKDLNKVIQLRVEEIVLNVLNQIQDSGYADKIPGGLIVTGGASLQAGLESFLVEKFKLPVRKASVNRVMINNVSDLVQNPAYLHALSLLLFANGNCEKPEEIIEMAAETSEDTVLTDQPGADNDTPRSQPQAQPEPAPKPYIQQEAAAHQKPKLAKKKPFNRFFVGLSSLFDEQKEE